MPLHHRQHPLVRAKSASPTRTSHLSKPSQTSKSKSPQLLTADQVPEWYSTNNWTINGYRPVTHSVRLCFASLRYMHNESVNIYTHLPSSVFADQLIFHIYLTTSLVCFGISAAYHTLLCHSEHYSNLWVRLDYAAIVIQILGSFVSGIYVSFYCEPRLQVIYWAMILVLGTIAGYINLSPGMQSPEWRSVRLASFVVTGFSAFAPIAHAVAIFPYGQLDQQAGLKWYYLEGVWMMAGSHYPEARYPKRFDIYGASHQVFHCFVVVGAALHFYGILSAYNWNYQHQRCSW
ncbi:mPR-like GPCR protein [Emericellopsis atlantica]|uniref:MPR-like GPCR protein n=1 Tax=Emericellopsis atlantica TaxID=2614577 RepID=A0A9P7ZGN1_9HYPO|nr:mPR-like GPCR protein [Emericellopsis atlantica]KAG9251798.1 mPR-like GPCR protein [Emericellopsis atlantica]